jgi:serine phosphatase RsbU (regulator of sigma subunit)
MKEGLRRGTYGDPRDLGGWAIETIRDITERRELEARLARSSAELEIAAEIQNRTLSVIPDNIPGDFLILFTDGLVEAQNSKGEHFGIKRVKAHIARHKNVSAKDLVEGLCDEAKRFAGTKPIRDDVTVVVIKLT